MKTRLLSCCLPGLLAIGMASVAAPSVATSAAAQTTPATAWPATAEGLLLKWQSPQSGQPQVRAADGAFQAVPPKLAGLAKFGRHGELNLRDGSCNFDADTPVAQVVPSMRKANAFTIEATIRCHDLTGKNLTPIITSSSSAKDQNYTLGQQDKSLVFELRTNGDAKPAHVKLAPLDDQPHHVLVRFDAAAKTPLTCHVDGKAVAITTQPAGDLTKWTEQNLTFGDEWEGEHTFDGTLEGVALFSRALTDKEAQAEYAAFVPRLADRAAPPRMEMDAVLLRKSPPDPGSQYPRYLVRYEYEVKKVTAGKFEGQKIFVVHWGMINRNFLDKLLQREEGKEYHLILENRKDHPETLKDTAFVRIGDYKAPEYLDVGPLKPYLGRTAEEVDAAEKAGKEGQ